ncbi:hypothetical protein AA14337_1488 [Acetobacter malorum DSM 14337]|uniref:Uncharacterized protein n=1 Tax=Acetobacter malorum DSM 14337 TaxID=1307910 RepID=A0ABQ0PSG7_9PROT|nr:hypothetical protein [Acetobacter malorum]KXV11992.1 hypothetical protein AD930_00125 [Acetobacter malorum]GBQ79604.1 hypothetical protein AA14337_1488 [Acetobacter malorum DSM 14337]
MGTVNSLFDGYFKDAEKSLSSPKDLYESYIRIWIDRYEWEGWEIPQEFKILWEDLDESEKQKYQEKFERLRQ